MATYFISDIHGEYELFIELLKEINFNKNDTLYILGDIIDKGKDSIKLLKFIIENKNMIAILGNHEATFLQYVREIALTPSQLEDEEIIREINTYFPSNNEEITAKEISYLSNLPYYIETEDFICVHAGLEVVNNKVLPLEQQNTNYLIYDRNFIQTKGISLDKPILLGHTPCVYTNNTGKFIKTLKRNHNRNNFSSYSRIRLDTGVSYTRMLGILRKEDMKEFYTK
ncbi:MAG: serine/threonine protein phosphatase [Clostridiales bacterium]|nr:serine/threonine protein phosphatase [Clostridiales bacterium]